VTLEVVAVSLEQPRHVCIILGILSMALRRVLQIRFLDFLFLFFDLHVVNLGD